MNLSIKNFLFVILLSITSCKSSKLIVCDLNNENEKPKLNLKLETVKISDSTFVNLEDYSKNFIFDMKYATTDNFLKAKVYDCAKCYLRLKTVNALIDANNEAIKMGYKIKIYDCYRPLDVQKKMWTIVSNPIYVANPDKGSIHNKGGAVDITLVNSYGAELDMGTAFDFFGEKASHNYQNLSDSIKNNRILLKNIMKNASFKSFDSEWWHYNLTNAINDRVSNFKWNCD